MLRLAVLAIALLAGTAVSAIAETPHLNGTYKATAYAQKGITASGQVVHRHVVAADPDILPIGTRIKIKHAGRYSGEYVVADTGEKIQGRRLDIYLPSVVACKKFGVKPVIVKVIQLGDGTAQAAKQADKAVKQDVKHDVVNNVVGNAATEADWNGKATATSTTATSTSSQKAVQSTSTTGKTDH